MVVNALLTFSTNLLVSPFQRLAKAPLAKAPHAKKQKGKASLEKTWILSAIEDLQRLASEHQMPSIAFALDGVMEVAETEVKLKGVNEKTLRRMDQIGPYSAVVEFPMQPPQTR